MKCLRLLVALLLVACGGVNSSFRGYVDPGVTPSSLNTVVVGAFGAGHIGNTDLEMYAASILEEAGVTAIQLNHIAPPVRDYTADEVKARIDGTEAQAIYVFFVASQDANKRTVMDASQATGAASCSGSTWAFDCDASYSSRGARLREVSNPQGTYEAALYSLPEGDVLWGGHGAASDDTRRDYGQGTVFGVVSNLNTVTQADLAKTSIGDSIADLQAKGFIK